MEVENAAGLSNDTDQNTEEIEIEIPPDNAWMADLNTGSLEHTSTMKIQMTLEIPYKIPPEVLLRAEDINPNDGSGIKTFEPSETECRLCSAPLGPAIFPQGCRAAGGNGVLMTNRHPFHPINIKQKKCTSKECGAINLLFPYEMGKKCVKYIREIKSMLDLILKFDY